MKKAPVKPTLGTLGPSARKVANVLMEGARKNFRADEGVMPVLLAMPDSGQPLIFPAVHRNGVEKQLVWAFLRFLRATHPVTALLSEAWISEVHKSKLSTMVPPSQDPNHIERVMLSLWEGERTVIFAADIQRNPTRLGQFFVFQDNLFPTYPKMGSFSGEIEKGPRYPTKAN